MFAEFGQAPLCLELDLDSYDGPWQHIARFRRGSGWLMVAECTIQSEYDILTARLVAACDEREHPVPAFQAKLLTECDWINPTYCDELAPDILDDLICEEEGALIARWHREKNSALAEAFENHEARIAELEGRVQSMIARNEAQIADLRQRRRHPDATPEMRVAMRQIIDELDHENDEMIVEMAETRATLREQAAGFEEALWAREDLLVEVTPLHIVRWTARSRAYADAPAQPPKYSTLWIPACGPTGGSTPKFDNMEGQIAAGLAKTAAREATTDTAKNDTAKDVVGVRPGANLPKHSPALRTIATPSQEKVEEPAPDSTGWTYKRVELLKSMWRDGQSASTIAAALGNTSRNAVISKSKRLDLPRREPLATEPRTPTSEIGLPKTSAPQQGEKGWTPEMVEVLESLWNEGTSADEISSVLGIRRNRVIGKAHRLGLGSNDKKEVMERLQPVLAPVALRNLQLERDRALRSLTALEVRGRKFFEGSKKFTRNREQRAELEEKIAELDQKIAKVAGRLKEHA